MNKNASPLKGFFILVTLFAILGIACNFSIPFIDKFQKNNDSITQTEEIEVPHSPEASPTMNTVDDPLENLLEYRPVPDNGVVFYYDPGIWSVDETMSPYYHLVANDESCEIFDPTYFGHGIAGPANRTPVYIGGRNWIETYGYLYSYRDDFVRIEIRASSNVSTCYDQAYEVLSTMKIEGENFVAENPMPTSTPQPLFVCTDAPNKIGYIGAAGYTIKEVRFRSSPEYLDTNVIQKLPEGTYFSIIGGPVCGEYPDGKYIYWEVEVQQNDGTILQGWLAEGDKENYYIEFDFGG